MMSNRETEALLPNEQLVVDVDLTESAFNERTSGFGWGNGPIGLDRGLVRVLRMITASAQNFFKKHR